MMCGGGFSTLQERLKLSQDQSAQEPQLPKTYHLELSAEAEVDVHVTVWLVFISPPLSKF